MENLPSHVADEILFRLPHRSLALCKCVNRGFRSIVSDPEFESEYVNRFGSGLIHNSSFHSKQPFFVPFVSNTGIQKTASLPTQCQILGSVSGLVLLFVGQLCVVNPITESFRVLTLKPSQVMHKIDLARRKRSMEIGLAVDQIDQTTQRFRVVCINKLMKNLNETRYRFDIYGDDDSWRESKTKITCPTSDLFKRVKPVYFNGALHWLRDEGSIVAFNPETEQARLISTTLPSLETGFEVLLGAVNGNLTLVSATEEVISVFVLQDCEVPKWVLEKQIKNDALEKGTWMFWTLAAYDGRFLVLQEKKKGMVRVLHAYDVRNRAWRVLDEIPMWLDHDRAFFQFEPSWSAVRGLQGPETSRSKRYREDSETTALLESHRIGEPIPSSLRSFMKMLDPRYN